MLLPASLAGASSKSVQRKGSTSKPSSVSSGSHRAKVVRTSAKTSRASRKRAKKTRGQLAIQGDRAREIQTALIRQGYLSGEPSGVWDQSTKDAMARFQADNGWQTRTLPDSRALIKLGLGPTHSSAMNAEPLPASLASGAEGAKSSNLPQNRQ